MSPLALTRRLSALIVGFAIMETGATDVKLIAKICPDQACPADCEYPEISEVPATLDGCTPLSADSAPGMAYAFKVHAAEVFTDNLEMTSNRHEVEFFTDTVGNVALVNTCDVSVATIDTLHAGADDFNQDLCTMKYGLHAAVLKVVPTGAGGPSTPVGGYVTCDATPGYVTRQSECKCDEGYYFHHNGVDSRTWDTAVPGGGGVWEAACWLQSSWHPCAVFGAVPKAGFAAHDAQIDRNDNSTRSTELVPDRCKCADETPITWDHTLDTNKGDWGRCPGTEGSGGGDSGTGGNGPEIRICGQLSFKDTGLAMCDDSCAFAYSTGGGHRLNDAGELVNGAGVAVEFDPDNLVWWRSPAFLGADKQISNTLANIVLGTGDVYVCADDVYETNVEQDFLLHLDPATLAGFSWWSTIAAADSVTDKANAFAELEKADRDEVDPLLIIDAAGIQANANRMATQCCINGGPVPADKNAQISSFLSAAEDEITQQLQASVALPPGLSGWAPVLEFSPPDVSEVNSGSGGTFSFAPTVRTGSLPPQLVGTCSDGDELSITSLGSSVQAYIGQIAEALQSIDVLQTSNAVVVVPTTVICCDSESHDHSRGRALAAMELELGFEVGGSVAPSPGVVGHEEKDDSKTGLIVGLSVGLGVPVLGAVVLFLVCYFRQEKVKGKSGVQQANTRSPPQKYKRTAINTV